jgi:hypothetical protein
MPHLIAAIHDVAIEECIATLDKAHRHLRDAAQSFLKTAEGIAPQYWGSDIKRLRVPLPKPRPDLLEQDSHNFIEVVNQLAGMERLLDGLRWFAEDHPAARVLSCHPSTSSARGENDVVVKSAEELFRVEVFDIVGDKIINNKLNKSLASFGFGSAWVPGRLMLFVSASVSARLLPRVPSSIGYHFSPMHLGTRTHVFEVVHGV